MTWIVRGRSIRRGKHRQSAGCGAGRPRVQPKGSPAFRSLGSHSETSWSPSPSGSLELILPSSPPWWPRQEFKSLKQFQLLTLQMDLGPSGSSENRPQSLGVATLGGREFSCAMIQEPKHLLNWGSSLENSGPGGSWPRNRPKVPHSGYTGNPTPLELLSPFSGTPLLTKLPFHPETPFLSEPLS